MDDAPILSHTFTVESELLEDVTGYDEFFDYVRLEIVEVNLIEETLEDAAMFPPSLVDSNDEDDVKH